MMVGYLMLVAVDLEPKNVLVANAVIKKDQHYKQLLII
jgi:hypothetical protein